MATFVLKIKDNTLCTHTRFNYFVYLLRVFWYPFWSQEILYMHCRSRHEGGSKPRDFEIEHPLNGRWFVIPFNVGLPPPMQILYKDCYKVNTFHMDIRVSCYVILCHTQCNTFARLPRTRCCRSIFLCFTIQC